MSCTIVLRAHPRLRAAMSSVRVFLQRSVQRCSHPDPQEQADIEEAWRVAQRANPARPLLRLFVAAPVATPSLRSDSTQASTGPSSASTGASSSAPGSASPADPLSALVTQLLASPEVRNLLTAFGVDLGSREAVQDLTQLFGRMGIDRAAAGTFRSLQRILCVVCVCVCCSHPP